MVSKVAFLILGLIAMVVLISSKGEARNLAETFSVSRMTNNVKEKNDDKVKNNEESTDGTGSLDTFNIPGIPGFGGIPGIPGFGGIPGIPEFGGIPGIPGFGGIPGIPGFGEIPGIPEIGGIPGIPGFGGIPGIPGFSGIPGIPGFGGIPGTPGVLGPPSPLAVKEKSNIDEVKHN